jgi:hypothetical protein
VAELKKKELNTFYDLMNDIQSKIDQYHKNRKARAKVTHKTRKKFESYENTTNTFIPRSRDKLSRDSSRDKILSRDESHDKNLSRDRGIAGSRYERVRGYENIKF